MKDKKELLEGMMVYKTQIDILANALVTLNTQEPDIEKLAKGYGKIADQIKTMQTELGTLRKNVLYFKGLCEKHSKKKR